jgi:ABC-type nitrate/sulfonate/bicarbonate transport system substrate-binding protein
MNRSLTACVGALLLGAALLAATWPGALSVARAGPAREKVTIGAVDNLLSALAMVAVSRGFYTKHGLDAELKLYRSGQEVAKALAAGDIVFGTSAMNNFQAEIQAGLEHVAYMVIMGDGASRDNDRPLAIVAAPGSGIRNPRDLRGKTVGLSLGGTAELYLRAVLEQAGLSADGDVRMVQVLPANSALALRTRQVDAISTWEPWNTQALREVPGAVEVARGGGYFNYVIFGLTRKSTLRERPDLVKREIAAKAEAAWWIRQNPREAAVAVSTWLSGLSVDLLADGLRNVPFDVRITEFTRIAWDQSYRLLSRWGRLKGPVPMQWWVDTRLLNEVIHENPRWFSDLKRVQLLQLRAR